MSAPRHDDILRQITGEQPRWWRKRLPGLVSGNAVLWLAAPLVLGIVLLVGQKLGIVWLPIRLELWPSMPGATAPAPYVHAGKIRRLPLVLQGVTNGLLQLVIVADGDAQTIVMSVTGVVTPTNRLAGQLLRDSGPIQSPDGASLAFIANTGIGDTIVIADGTGWRAVTPPVFTGGLVVSQASYLSWSPDGRSLAFTAQAEDGLTSWSELFVYTLTRSQLSQLSFMGRWVSDPLWIDNARIAYIETDRDGSANLFLQAVDAHEAEQLFSIHPQP